MTFIHIISNSFNMTDRAYGYFELDLFNGSIKLPLKLCTSYPSDDDIRNSASTKCGVLIDDSPKIINRVYCVAKDNVKKIKSINDITKIVEWNDVETFINTGTTTRPKLKKMNDDIKNLLIRDKERSKDRTIISDGFYNLNLLMPYHYTGRHFHTYPHTYKVKNSSKDHIIYQTLCKYLYKNKLFLKVTYFSKGEELGALSYCKKADCLRLSGLHADNDLKPNHELDFDFNTSKDLKNLMFEKFDSLKKNDSELELILNWRDFVNESLKEQGISKEPSIKQNIKVNIDDLTNLFKNL